MSRQGEHDCLFSPPRSAGIEQGPQRLKRAIGGLKGKFAIAISDAVSLNQIGTGPRVPYIGLLMHRKETESALVSDPVKSLEAVDFRTSHCGNLRFVGIQRSKAARHVTTFCEVR